MNVYQKIAIFLFRIIGIASFIYGLNVILYAAILTFMGSQIERINASYALFSTAYYLIPGVVLLLFSTFLGKLLGKGLD